MKLTIFLRFCFERGYIITTDAKGNDAYSQRPFDEYLWPESSNPLPIPSWKSFRTSWKRRCPTIRIRNVCEDTCPECYILKNKFRYAGNNNNNNNNVQNAASESSSTPDDEQSNNNDSDENSIILSPDENSDEEKYPYEELIAEANEHAEEAQQQRSLAQNRQQLAIEEALNPHEDRRFVIIFF